MDNSPASWPPAPEVAEPKIPVRKENAVSGWISLVMGALQLGFFLLTYADEYSATHWDRPILPPINVTFYGYGLRIFWTALFLWLICSIAFGVAGRRSKVGKIGLAEAVLTVVCVGYGLSHWGGT